jgi:hypothetical protein
MVMVPDSFASAALSNSSPLARFSQPVSANPAASKSAAVPANPIRVLAKNLFFFIHKFVYGSPPARVRSLATDDPQAAPPGVVLM